MQHGTMRQQPVFFNTANNQPFVYNQCQFVNYNLNQSQFFNTTTNDTNCSAHNPILSSAGKRRHSVASSVGSPTFQFVDHSPKPSKSTPTSHSSPTSVGHKRRIDQTPAKQSNLMNHSTSSNQLSLQPIQPNPFNNQITEMKSQTFEFKLTNTSRLDFVFFNFVSNEKTTTDTIQTIFLSKT